MSARGSTPTSSSRCGQRRAEPAGVAREVPADLVRDAGERDVALDHRPGQQLGEVELDLPVHHPVHPQPPAVGGHLRHDQRGVDPVEVPGRSREGAQPGDLQLAAGRERGRGRRRRRQPDGGAGGRHLALAGVHGPADDPGEQRDRPDPSGCHQQLAALLVGGDRGAGRDGSQQQDQRHRADHRAHQRRERVQRLGVRPGGGGDRTHEPEHRDTGEADRSPAYGQGTRHERHQQKQHEDRPDQDVLVVGAELGDRPLPQPGRRRVDDGVADRHDR